MTRSPPPRAPRSTDATYRAIARGARKPPPSRYRPCEATSFGMPCRGLSRNLADGRSLCPAHQKMASYKRIDGTTVHKDVEEP